MILLAELLVPIDSLLSDQADTMKKTVAVSVWVGCCSAKSLYYRKEQWWFGINH